MAWVVQCWNISRMDIKQKFGAAMRERRVALEMSQEDLGIQIGLDQGYVSRIEHGQRNITLDMVGRICVALNCEAGDLFG